MRVAEVALLSLLAHSASAWPFGDWDDLIVPPPSGKSGDPAVLIFGQGASIKTEAYKPLAQAIQNAVSFPLWFASPQCPEDIAAIPLGLSNGVERVKKALATQGANATRTFYGGHSLGGAMMPKYVQQNAPDADGMVLLGSFITRDFKTAHAADGRPQFDFPVPTLTIGGELDGLCRITRIAESLYTQVTFAEDPSSAMRKFPVTTITGMSHMQFASGTPPSFVKDHDLKSEITDDDAHAKVAADVASFLNAIAGDESAWGTLESRVKESVEFTQPIIDALNMEAYHQFLPPCLCENKDEYGGKEYGTCQSTPSCTGGTPWTERAQQIMGSGIDGLTITAADSSHIVTETKPSCHLPHIHGSNDSSANPGNGKYPPLCDSPNGCALNITTVTQQIYDNFGEEDIYRFKFNISSLDTGFLAISASEFKAKMKSRQAVYQAAGQVNASYADTDKPASAGGTNGDRCGEINQAAIDWAKSKLPQASLARFEKYGQPLEIGPDQGTCAAGPCWIWDSLKWKDDKKTKVTIESVWFGSENKNIYPCGDTKTLPCDSGFHYCKLLSPARALEWMMVDGLRINYSIKNM